MKSRLTVSFGGVADREKKHLGKKASGIRSVWAPGRRIVRAFLGRLAFGPSPLGAPGRRIDRIFLGRPAFGPSPIGALVLGRLARGTGAGSMVPTRLIYYRFIIMWYFFSFSYDVLFMRTIQTGKTD